MKQKTKDVDFWKSLCLHLAVSPSVISRAKVKYSTNTESVFDTKVLL